MARKYGIFLGILLVSHDVLAHLHRPLYPEKQENQVIRDFDSRAT